MRTILTFAALVALAAAQPSTKTIGLMSGTAKDATTGAPLANVPVYATGASRAQTTTDSAGHYTLGGLAPGAYRVVGTGLGLGPLETIKRVTLGAGQDLTSIDFSIQTFAQISGKVLDENKEPVPGLTVYLVGRLYRLGALEYVYAGVGRTDDQGNYRMERVTPGRAFFLMVQSAPGKLNAVSDAPAEPKLRKKVFPPTYYPGSTFMDAAQPLILRSGERREWVDFQLARVPSFCIEGVMEVSGAPAVLDFQVGPRRPTSGRLASSAFYTMMPFGQTGPDGKIRICGLTPGDYQLTVSQRAAKSNDCPPFFGLAQVNVTDMDVRNLRVDVPPRLPIPGEVVWDGIPPDKPLDAKLSISLEHLTRGPFMGESESLTAKSSIPGEFNYPGVLVDEYTPSLSGLPKELYVKEITYAGASVLRAPLRVGSAIGNATLRITLARDGGVINAKVAVKDGNPVPDSYVLIMPAEATTEAALAAALINGQTDQNGVHTTNAMAPGKYLVLASTTPIDLSPESIGKLYQARTRAQEVTLAPNANISVTINPVL